MHRLHSPTNALYSAWARFSIRTASWYVIGDARRSEAKSSGAPRGSSLEHSTKLTVAWMLSRTTLRSWSTTMSTSVSPPLRSTAVPEIRRHALHWPMAYLHQSLAMPSGTRTMGLRKRPGHSRATIAPSRKERVSLWIMPMDHMHVMICTWHEPAWASREGCTSGSANWYSGAVVWRGGCCWGGGGCCCCGGCWGCCCCCCCRCSGVGGRGVGGRVGVTGSRGAAGHSPSNSSRGSQLVSSGRSSSLAAAVWRLPTWRGGAAARCW
mmetsp:Transcript_12163/g.34399  ORF Transcript_12163/g.34399 Transcript_12163/m.34399 type:complete len:266 (-) Transcript_12163:1760-2557(-)